MRVLIVEDDPELAALLREGLREQRIDPALASTFAEGLERGRGTDFDVVILDVRLPGGTGFDLCRRLREEGVAAPVLMLTALDAVDDRVRGLEAGADDYLTKPFDFRELVARIKALARRRPSVAPAVHKITDLTVDLSARPVSRAGRSIPLTVKEFALLELFVLHAGAVVDRASITAHVCDDNHAPSRTLRDVLIRLPPPKIDDPFTPKLIATVRGAGSRLG